MTLVRPVLALLLASFSAPFARGQEELEPAELARLARLDAIALALQAPEANAVELATEAVRLCGFVIWNEDRKVLAEPTGAPRLRLAITDAEIREYALMFREGHRVAQKDLVAGLDVFYQGLGLDGSIQRFVDEWLRHGEWSDHASVRALTAFLHDLGAQRAEEHGRLDVDEACELDPLQTLLMVRVLTEDMATPLRRAIARGAVPPGEDFPKLERRPQDEKDREKESSGGRRGGPRAETAPYEEAPGWAEDAYVGGVTGLFGEIANRINESGRRISNAAARANAITTIAKFIATYTFLRGEMDVDAPGQPLVRTKNTDPGEERTLIARFYIDGTRVTDWMKEHRQLAALAGLDLDMPRTGALKGVETAWDIEQNRHYATRQIIQVAEGQGDISKIKTDQNGEARVRVEGKPQLRAFDPNDVLPLEKSLRITVTPQVKEVQIQQDLVDAVTGAIGIYGGGVGFLTPVIECLYRMKWKGGRWMMLRIRDWQPAETIGQLDVTINATGSTFTRYRASRTTLNRSLGYADVHLHTTGVEPPPPIDPKVLQRSPPHVRAQIEAGMRAMAEAAKHRYYSSKGIGTIELHIHDSQSGSGLAGECGGPHVGSSSATWDGDLVKTVNDESMPWELPFLVELDLEKRTAKLSFGVSANAHVVEIRRSSEKTERSERDESMQIFSGLQLEAPFDQGIVIPLQETEVIGMNASNYHGAETVRFTFGGGYRGSAIVSFSVTRKLLPPGGR